MMSGFRFAAMSAAVAALALSPWAASAQNADGAFKAKRMTIVAAGGAGGGYDTYSRLLARHYAKHLPGGPTITVQNMNAAGGMVLANHAFVRAAKDGSYVANIRPSVLFEQLFGNKAVQFEGPKFAYIGNMNEDTDGCVFWHTVKANSVQDFYTQELIIGGSDRSAMSFSFPALFNAVLGTRFNIILGYRGTPIRLYAMERGELHGACGITTTTIKAVLGQALSQGRIKVLAVAGNNPAPDFKHVPNMLDQAKDPEARAALKFLFSQMQAARLYAVAPGTPRDIVASLRASFVATMKDSAFVKDAERTRSDIVWTDGAAAQKVVDELYASDPKVVARVKAALTATAKEKVYDYRRVKAELTAVNPRGSQIQFVDKGEKVRAAIAGRATKVTIKGKKATGKDLKAGMTCAVDYAGSFTDAKSVSCE